MRCVTHQITKTVPEEGRQYRHDSDLHLTAGVHAEDISWATR